jgi:hypothetical protein
VWVFCHECYWLVALMRNTPSDFSCLDNQQFHLKDSSIVIQLTRWRFSTESLMVCVSEILNSRQHLHRVQDVYLFLLPIRVQDVHLFSLPIPNSLLAKLPHFGGMWSSHTKRSKSTFWCTHGARAAITDQPWITNAASDVHTGTRITRRAALRPLMRTPQISDSYKHMTVQLHKHIIELTYKRAGWSKIAHHFSLHQDQCNSTASRFKSIRE